MIAANDPAPGRRCIGVATVLVTTAIAGAVVIGRHSGLANPLDSYGYSVVATIAFTALGDLILHRDHRSRVGWLFVANGAVNGVVAISASFGRVAVMGWLQQWTLSLPLALVVLLLLVFPDGHLLSPRWRGAVGLVSLGAVASAVGLAVAVWRVPRLLLDYEQAVAVVPGAALVVAGVGFALVALGMAAGLLSLWVRWRRSSGVVREQLKVLALGGLVTVAGFVATFSTGVTWLWPALGLVIPLSTGAAVLQYRLYDADLLLNRSLVSAGLALVLLAAYMLTVNALGAVFADWNPGVSPLLATGVVAVLFEPVRERVRRGISRLLYGSRDDPQAVFGSLSRSLERAGDPGELLIRVVATVAETLLLPYVAIAAVTRGRSDIVVQYGRQGMAPQAFLMVYGGQTVGRLLAAPRSISEPLTSGERRLLQDLAGRAAMVVHANRLTLELRRSRERLVRSREEERRRLRRDLHDGLGPTLAGMTMQVGAAQSLLVGECADIHAASRMLHALEGQLQASVGEVRGVVDDLRPPNLDQLGLLPALRRRLQAFSVANADVAIDIDGPDAAGELPAAVEVAVYRIALEAVTNVVRHARATSCRVVITVGPNVVLEVVDDGVGLPTPVVPGVGLTSMRERAEELGGEITIAADQGTRIRAVLPTGVR